MIIIITTAKERVPMYTEAAAASRCDIIHEMVY